MIRFLYSRLYASGYDFHIGPETPVGRLYDAICNDMIGDEQKLLFLQNAGGKITFGVREQLVLRDERGRLRCHFTGFQLVRDESADDVPFLKALDDRFDAITAEAIECHRILDGNLKDPESLRQTDIRFDRAASQKAIAWDNAVKALRDNPAHSFLMMFGHDGRKLQLPFPSPEAELKPKLPPLPPRDTKTSPAKNAFAEGTADPKKSVKSRNRQETGGPGVMRALKGLFSGRNEKGNPFSTPDDGP